MDHAPSSYKAVGIYVLYIYDIEIFLQVLKNDGRFLDVLKMNRYFKFSFFPIKLPISIY